MTRKRANRIRRHKRVRAKIFGTATRPRFSVFRSSRHLHVQLINDEIGETLVAASTLEVSSSAKQEDKIQALAKRLNEKARQAGIKQVVFDRGGYKYHGQVKLLARAVRDAGLKV